MLDVIGAGATATSEINWHEKWRQSPEARRVQEELDKLHETGRLRPPVTTTLHSQYATSWIYQLRTLLGRAFSSYWRNPTYILAKVALNIISGLIIGFTFYQSSDTLQGTQNKLFVGISS